MYSVNLNAIVNEKEKLAQVVGVLFPVALGVMDVNDSVSMSVNDLDEDPPILDADLRWKIHRAFEIAGLNEQQSAQAIEEMQNFGLVARG